MRSPISVATLAALFLLLSSPEAARAARPKTSASKKALIDAELRKAGFVNLVRDNAVEYVRARLQDDPRISNREPPFDVEFAKALAASVDAEAVHRVAFDHYDQAFTERELKTIAEFYRSKAGTRLLTVGNTMWDDVRREVISMFAANYELVLSARLREAPAPVVAVEASPSPTPSPSLVAEPSRRPSPKVSEVEASWLTKMIWKWFPETNKCGPS